MRWVSASGIRRSRAHWPRFVLGSDALGRSLGIRLLTGGGISLGIGIAAAAIELADHFGAYQRGVVFADRFVGPPERDQRIGAVDA